MNQPTNSNGNEIPPNPSISSASTENYKNQLNQYYQKHSEKYQKHKKDSQVKAKKERHGAGSNRRLVKKGIENSKRLIKVVKNQTYIHANPNSGVEAYIDIGNLRLSHDIPPQQLTNTLGRVT